MGEEQVSLKEMQKEDAKLRTDYETLMQTLGKQSMRTKIMEAHTGVLDGQRKYLKQQRDRINETERGVALKEFDSNSWKVKLYLIGVLAFFAIVWGTVASLSNNFFRPCFNHFSFILVVCKKPAA